MQIKNKEEKEEVNNNDVNSQATTQNQQTEAKKDEKTKNEAKIEDKKIEMEELISFDYINYVLQMQNQNKSLAGFRKGKIPLDILQAQNPDIFDNILHFHLLLKNTEAKKQNSEVSIDKIDHLQNGIKVYYKLQPITKK